MAKNMQKKLRKPVRRSQARGGTTSRKPRTSNGTSSRATARATELLAELGIEGRVARAAKRIRKPRRAGVARGDAAVSIPFERAFDLASGAVVQLARADAPFGALGLFTSTIAPGWLGIEVDAVRTVRGEAQVKELGPGRKLVGVRPGGSVFLNGSEPGALIVNEAAAVTISEIAPAPAADVIAEIVATFGAPQWLKRESSRLARLPGPLAPAKAVGMAARLWTRGEIAENQIRETMMSGRTPTRIAREWWHGLGGAARDEVLSTALDEVVTLTESLTELADLAAVDRGFARAAAARWLDARDDLQSVSWLMREKDETPLAEALRELDQHAVTHLALWTDLAVGPGARRAATSWIEPGAWWGRLR